MNKNTATATAPTRETFANMEPQEYQELRNAYYKAAEGIATITELLNNSDNKALATLRASAAKLTATMTELDVLGRYL